MAANRNKGLKILIVTNIKNLFTQKYYKINKNKNIFKLFFILNNDFLRLCHSTITLPIFIYFEQSHFVHLDFHLKKNLNYIL